MMLASRLMAKLKVRNLAALGAEDATTLLDAMNGGIKEWTDGLPPARRQTTVCELVPEPVSVTISILEGAREFSYVTPPFPLGGYANEEALLGKAVTLAGSTQTNRLDQPSTLLKPHLGGSGDVVATIWGDAIGFPDTSARLVSIPIWEGETTGRWELQPLRACLTLPDHGWHTGPPTHYATTPLHPVLHGNPSWFLRLWPLPAARGTVSFTLERTPVVLTLEALQLPVDIPLPDHDIADLLPLCEERLSSTPLWSEKADKQRTWADATRSRERLARLWHPLDARPALIQTPQNW